MSIPCLNHQLWPCSQSASCRECTPMPGRIAAIGFFLDKPGFTQAEKAGPSKSPPERPHSYSNGAAGTQKFWTSLAERPSRWALEPQKCTAPCRVPTLLFQSKFCSRPSLLPSSQGVTPEESQSLPEEQSHPEGRTKTHSPVRILEHMPQALR